MPKIAWCTDIHLDHFHDSDRNVIIKLGESLIERQPEAVLITGDISVSSKLIYHLSALEKVVQRPVYFVLGNHDYYGSTIEKIRESMRDISNLSQYLKYLPMTPYVSLSPNTALIGHDGWYDASCGDVGRSPFIMRDWQVIGDYVREGVLPHGLPDYNKIIAISRKLAYESVLHVSNSIKTAVKYHKNIIIATHFPPFEESHAGNRRTDNIGVRPWYTSKIMGETLLRAAAAYPQINFEVFSGHSHGKFEGKIANNLHCHVGQSDYGQPQLAREIDLP